MEIYQALAKEFNISVSKLTLEIRYYGLQQDCKKPLIPKDELREKMDLGWSNTEIAEFFKVPRGRVSKSIEVYGFQRSQAEQNIVRERAMIQKIGVKSPMDLPGWHEKVRETMIEKYGTEHAMLIPEFIEKRDKTCLEKFGYKSPAQNPEVQQKMRATMLEKYGHEYCAQCPEIMQKMRDNYRAKTGYDYSLQNPEVRVKIQQSTLNNHGVENPGQIVLSEKARSVLLNKKAFEDYLKKCPFKFVIEI